MNDQELRDAIKQLDSARFNDFEKSFTNDVVFGPRSQHSLSEKQAGVLENILNSHSGIDHSGPEPESFEEAAQRAVEPAVTRTYPQPRQAPPEPPPPQPRPAPAQRAPARQGPDIKALIEAQRCDVVDVLPASVREDLPRYMARAAMYWDGGSPELKRCRPESFVKCVIQSAAAGLPLDGNLAYAVPYAGEAKFMPSYKGLVTLARRSGRIKDVWSDVIKEGDEFRFARTDRGDEFRHAIGFPRGKTVGVYARLVFDDETSRTVALDRDHIDNVRDAAKVGSNPSWKFHYDEMAKKVAIRNILKTETGDADECLLRAMEADNRHFDLNQPRERALIADGTPSVFEEGADELRKQNTCVELMAQVEGAAKEPDPAMARVTVEQNIEAANLAGDLHEKDYVFLKDQIGGE